MNHKNLLLILKKYRRPFSVVLLSMIFTFLLIDKNGLLMPITEPNFYLRGDHNYYIKMAEGTNDLNIAPFCWRIGVPFVANLFPSYFQGFLTISVISFVFVGLAVFLLAETFNFSGILPYVGLLFFYLLEGVQFALYDFYLPDALLFVCITLSIILIKLNKDIYLVFLLIFGITIKESVLFIIPLIYSLRASSIFDWNSIKKTILISLPSILVLVFIRILIKQDNASYNYFSLFLETIPHHIDKFSINNYFINAFGITSVLPFLSMRKNKELFLRFSPFILLVFSQLLFAYDSGRLLALAFPATILMSLNTICSK